jgi:hypothetical protein
MSPRLSGAAAFVAVLFITLPCFAQAGSATAPPDAGIVTTAKSKAGAKAPRPAPAVIITNGRSHAATEVVIVGDDDKTTKLSKRVPPKGKVTVKLPKLTGCTVHVAATFEGEGEVEFGELDICTEKTLRFTD